MVEDLFELSRATSAALRLQRKRLALCEVGSDAVAAETAAGVDVQVRASDPDDWPIVLGSEPELTRVIRNLVGNAIRHTPPGGVVRIAAGTRGENAWLTVRDECGGIPQDELPRLFQAGFRGTAARTPDARSGAGLGLTIAKALVEAQQGHIHVENTPTGCVFEIVLPLAEPSRAARRRAPHASSGRAGPPADPERPAARSESPTTQRGAPTPRPQQQPHA
jgi:signal transduction histidine kinase